MSDKCVFLNPGTGPVRGYAHRVSERWARSNARKFAAELGATCTQLRRTPDDGRWLFRITRGKRSVVVDMPGCALARVRYTDAENQNIWHYPRLYVDGSSYVWLYAIVMAAETLRAPEPRYCAS